MNENVWRRLSGIKRSWNAWRWRNLRRMLDLGTKGVGVGVGVEVEAVVEAEDPSSREAPRERALGWKS